MAPLHDTQHGASRKKLLSIHISLALVTASLCMLVSVSHVFFRPLSPLSTMAYEELEPQNLARIYFIAVYVCLL